MVWLETPTTPEGLFPCGLTDGSALSKPGCWKERGKKLFVASGSFAALRAEAGLSWEGLGVKKVGAELSELAEMEKLFLMARRDSIL